MKAIVYDKYGPPEVLYLTEIDKPEPKDNEVLLKVHATSINASDLEFVTANPAYVRVWGLFKPKNKILGSDIAGTIEAVGKDVKNFKVGDAVFADVFEKWGGFAEYVCIHEKELVLKPDFITFEQAAAIPQSAVVALQGLRNKGKLQAGQKVLINGAGGGAGTFAVQLAKYFGAEVTGVDSAEKIDLIRTLGADHVIDYKNEDFTKNKEQYDLILDLVGHHTIFAFKRSLTKNGIYVMVGGSLKSIFQAVLIGSLISMVSNKKMGMLLHRRNTDDLKFFLELIKNGTIRPVIDKVYPLDKTSEAFRYFFAGHAKGKIVISIEY